MKHPTKWIATSNSRRCCHKCVGVTPINNDYFGDVWIVSCIPKWCEALFLRRCASCTSFSWSIQAQFCGPSCLPRILCNDCFTGIRVVMSYGHHLKSIGARVWPCPGQEHPRTNLECLSSSFGTARSRFLSGRFRRTKCSTLRGELDSSTPRVFRVFWMVVFDGCSLPRKSEKSVKIGKHQPINRPLIQWGPIETKQKTGCLGLRRRSDLHAGSRPTPFLERERDRSRFPL